MIKDTFSLKEILVSFEGTLRIEYSEELSTRQIIEQAMARMENTYEIFIKSDLFSMQAENDLVADKVNMLLRDIVECMKQMTLYTSLCLFNKSVGISLADVNYLGNDKAVLRTVLRYFQDASESSKWASALESITATLDSVPICTVKRLFVILLVLNELGIYEGVSVVAQYLYLGGLVE